ncbi:hypothetical protein D3C78_1675430 [compost metagenome]
MTRQTARNRVNTKAYFDAARTQSLGNFRYRILRLRYRHAIAWGDDHRMRVFQHISGVFGRNFTVLTDFFIARGRSAIGTKSTCNHAEEGAVHRLTHNVRQDRT